MVGNATAVTVVVYNAGTDASTLTTYSYTFQGETYTGSLPVIASGGSTTLSFSVQSNVYGASSLNVVLDPSGYVTETDESNNSRARTISWTQDPVGDLSITGISIANATVTPGGTASITPTIYFNADGTADAQSVAWRIVRSDSTSTTLNSGTVSVAADASASPTCTFSDASGSGSTSYRLVIDYDDTIPESDETNNYVAFTINWSASG